MSDRPQHRRPATFKLDDPHVIVDVGGQDIKLIVLHDGRVKDFKLNTQCSAGNGYFLQSTAEGFGLSVNQYADLAFSAQSMPVFGYGCAVFMQSDIVNFQRQGWRAEEILAGLRRVRISIHSRAEARTTSRQSPKRTPPTISRTRTRPNL